MMISSPNHSMSKLYNQKKEGGLLLKKCKWRLKMTHIFSPFFNPFVWDFTFSDKREETRGVSPGRERETRNISPGDSRRSLQLLREEMKSTNLHFFHQLDKYIWAHLSSLFSKSEIGNIKGKKTISDGHNIIYNFKFI